MFRKKGSSPFVFNVKSRMRVAGMLILLAPLCIFVRLFYMQTFLYEEFSSKAERAIYNYLAEDRLRGKILDVNGRELAESVRTHSCGVNKRYVQNKNKTVDFLSQTLGIPKKRILEKWNRASNFFFVAKKIKPDTYIKISQILRTNLGQGLELTPEYERIHPYGASAMDLIGASNSKNLGLSGIEQMYNRELSQDISKKRAKRARRGEIIYDRKLKEELSVANVYLTIDAVAQFYAENALKKEVEAIGAKHGVAIVQEPKTGKILAAASYPVKDGQSLAFQFTYEPGSTFKTIAISSALDAGVVHITDSIDMSGREWKVASTLTVRDNQHKKDFLSIPEIMQLSSNIGAGKIALELGAKNLYYYIKGFGFGTKTDINFNGESKGNLSHFNKWTVVDTATKGYGYGVAVTPIQLINAYSAIANGGTLMQPHIIDRIEYAGGKGVKIAFENLRKIGNVAYFADRYEGADNVVFCYDCGHEHCYTQTVCFPDIFRDRMTYTHIHDNFGRSKDDYYGDPDLHLMPFDGEIDYSRVVRKLDEYGYEGSLTLEVFNSIYPDESRESFIARAYDAIIRISRM